MGDARGERSSIAFARGSFAGLGPQPSISSGTDSRLVPGSSKIWGWLEVRSTVGGVICPRRAGWSIVGGSLCSAPKAASLSLDGRSRREKLCDLEVSDNERALSSRGDSTSCGVRGVLSSSCTDEVKLKPRCLEAKGSERTEEAVEGLLSFARTRKLLSTGSALMPRSSLLGAWKAEAAQNSDTSSLSVTDSNCGSCSCCVCVTCWKLNGAEIFFFLNVW